MSSAAILRGHLAQVLEPQLVRAPIYTYSSYQAMLKMSEEKAKDEKQTVATEIREPAEEDMRADVKQYSVSMVAEQATLHDVSKAVDRIERLLVRLLDQNEAEKKKSHVREPQVLKTQRRTKAEGWEKLLALNHHHPNLNRWHGPYC